MGDLAGLVERVGKASGPDEQLDLDIAEAVGVIHRDERGKLFMPDDFGGRVYGGLGDHILVGDLTSSIDAALALVAKVLPGAADYSISVWLVAGNHDRPTARIWNDDVEFRSRGANPALALLLALLSALTKGSPDV